jgi:exopolyphosphatase/guanosine-5'-triphosphate,3'-diphosphate pyrophosphatase
VSPVTEASPRDVAVIDIGTNSTRLLVAEVTGSSIVERERLLTITRLGQGVDRTGRLDPAAVERTEEAVAGFVERARLAGVERILATGTSALRDAHDGRAFMDGLARRFSIESRILTGELEAGTTFAGVTSDADPTAGIAIIDVGGGSTELVIGDASGPVFARSVQLGSVRITERHLGEGRVAPDRLLVARADVRAVAAAGFAGAPLERATVVVAVAGTATTLAALDLGLPAYDPERIHGHVLTRAVVVAWRDRLAGMELDERLALPGLEPGRAPVIVGGALVLETVLDVLGRDEARISDRDILHGIALLAAAEDAPAPGR